MLGTIDSTLIFALPKRDVWDLGLAYSIKVVQQILILSVEVRILVGQQG